MIPVGAASLQGDMIRYGAGGYKDRLNGEAISFGVKLTLLHIPKSLGKIRKYGFELKINKKF